VEEKRQEEEMSKHKNRKNMVKSFFFPSLANYEIKVTSTNDVPKAVKQAKFSMGENEGSAEAMVFHDNNSVISYLFIPNSTSLGTVVHECYHVVRRMGLKLAITDTNEFTAYHLGDLVQRISDWRWSWK
jgi:hypothetical protein